MSAQVLAPTISNLPQHELEPEPEAALKLELELELDLHLDSPEERESEDAQKMHLSALPKLLSFQCHQAGQGAQSNASTMSAQDSSSTEDDMLNPEEENGNRATRPTSLAPSRLATRTLEIHMGDIVQNMLKQQADCDRAFCLRRHNITPSLRAKMVDWMVEVLRVFDCSEATFFKAVSIMDLYYARTTR
jgi:hypothetical protein